MSEFNGNRILRPDQPQVGHISSNGPLELATPLQCRRNRAATACCLRRAAA